MARFQFGVELADPGFGFLAFPVGADRAREVGAGDDQGIQSAGGLDVVRRGIPVQGDHADDLSVVQQGKSQKMA
jgi:hypothetical protein